MTCQPTESASMAAEEQASKHVFCTTPISMTNDESGLARSVVVARYTNTSLDKVKSMQPPRKKYGMRHPSRKKIKGVTTQMDKEDLILRPEQEKKARTPVGVIKNFRQVIGLPNIYRCARTDDLADRLERPKKSLSPGEKMILYKAGLILDLRSPSEIKQEKIGKWMDEAPGGKITLVKGEDDKGLVTNEKRGMLNIDVLGPKDFSSYAEENWLTSAQEIIQLAFYKAVDGTKLHNMRVEALNKRGLVGLNEVILESGKEHLCRALKAITLHLERKGDDHCRPIVIHCAQGKDRTGMLVMLLQSIIGVSDEDITNDYHASETMIDFTKGENNDDEKPKGPRPGKLDRAKMRRAPKLAMVETLGFVRKKYGSVSPGYFQAIGFDDTWRIRLVTALLLDMDRRKQSRRSRSSRL